MVGKYKMFKVVKAISDAKSESVLQSSLLGL